MAREMHAKWVALILYAVVLAFPPSIHAKEKKDPEGEEQLDRIMAGESESEDDLMAETHARLSRARLKF